jgi:hypothetical protein
MATSVSMLVILHSIIFSAKWSKEKQRIAPAP